MRRTVGMVALLTALAPLNALVTGFALLRTRRGVRPAADPRTVLISGGKMTKALALARAFHRAGHRVVLVETHKYRFTGHRFSRAVAAFHVVPEPTDPGYAAALARVVEREGVDVYVPVCSPVASVHDADAGETLPCEVVHGDGDAVRRVDDKHAFAEAAAALGLRVPDTHRITDPRQVADFDFGRSQRPYILKRIAYDPVRRLDLTPLPRPTPEETAAFAAALPISPESPWILQELISGTEFCTHSTVRDGRVRLHCSCVSSAWQINYAQVDKPEIDAWVRRFVGGLGLTGQYSMDFIEDERGDVYAIECNPRTHSAITLLQDHPGVAAAYLEDAGDEVRPLPGTKSTYWIYHEVWRLLTQPGRWARLRTIARGRDAIFDRDDPLPFLVEHHVQIPLLLLRNLRERRGWVRIDFNIGKLVEAGGD